MGRPRKYANDAEKMRAYRARYAVKSFRFEKHTAETIEKLAAVLDQSESEVVNSMIKFALTNYNWQTLGLWGKRLPHANPD